MQFYWKFRLLSECVFVWNSIGRIVWFQTWVSATKQIACVREWCRFAMWRTIKIKINLSHTTEENGCRNASEILWVRTTPSKYPHDTFCVSRTAMPITYISIWFPYCTRISIVNSYCSIWICKHIKLNLILSQITSFKTCCCTFSMQTYTKSFSAERYNDMRVIDPFRK